MKIFMTGATGVLGRRVVKLLRQENHEIGALSRSHESAQQLESMGVESFLVDLFDPKEIISATEGFDAIFHLATHIPKVPIPRRSIHWKENDQIRVQGTQNLLEAARCNGIECFIQPSITIIYGDKAGDYVHSKSPIAERVIRMARSAVEMEKIIRAESRLKHVILRFASFYGSDTFHTQNLIEQARGSRLPVIGNGDTYMNFIHVDDAAGAICYAYKNRERLENSTLNFSDFSPIKASTFMTTMAQKFGSKKPIYIPKFMARPLLGKDLYQYLTDSYRIQPDPLTSDWKPAFANFWEGLEAPSLAAP